jgi:hypothetical protein
VFLVVSIGRVLRQKFILSDERSSYLSWQVLVLSGEFMVVMP